MQIIFGLVLTDHTIHNLSQFDSEAAVISSVKFTCLIYHHVVVLCMFLCLLLMLFTYVSLSVNKELKLSLLRCIVPTCGANSVVA